MAGSPTNQEHFDFWLPDNANPKMVDWGLVDHNGGKFPRHTEVSLDVYIPPTFQEGDDSVWPHGVNNMVVIHVDAEGMVERKMEWEHDCTRKIHQLQTSQA